MQNSLYALTDAQIAAMPVKPRVDLLKARLVNYAWEAHAATRTTRISQRAASPSTPARMVRKRFRGSGIPTRRPRLASVSELPVGSRRRLERSRFTDAQLIAIYEAGAVRTEALFAVVGTTILPGISAGTITTKAQIDAMLDGVMSETRESQMCFGNNQQTGSSTGQTAQSTNEIKSTTYDPWVTQAGQNAVSGAQDWLNANPWQNYAGPTVAAFGPQFGQASDYLGGQLGRANPYTVQGAGGVASAMGAINPNASISDYMNPYVQGVLQPMLAQVNRAYREAGQNNAANATMAGAYGGTAQGVRQALLDKDYGTAVTDATNKAYSDAFMNAQASRAQNLGLLGQLGQGLAGIGQNAFQQGSTLASLLAGLGSTQQQAGQQGIQNAIKLNETNQTMPLNRYGMISQMLCAIRKTRRR